MTLFPLLFLLSVQSSHVCPASLQGHVIVSFTTPTVKGLEFAAFIISIGGFARLSTRSNVSSTIIGLTVPRSASFWSRRIRYYDYLDETNLRLQDSMFQNELFQRSLGCCDDTVAAQICNCGTAGTLILRTSDHRFVAVHICKLLENLDRRTLVPGTRFIVYRSDVYTGLEA